MILICETASSNWNYHLREAKEPKYGGGAGTALCGAAVGWDTKIPLAAWGIKDHLPSKWCATCQKMAEGTLP